MVDKSGLLKLLYVTPERLAKSKQFMNKLEKSYALGLLSRIAIDEVHCCSQWGHDFRWDRMDADFFLFRQRLVVYLWLWSVNLRSSLVDHALLLSPPRPDYKFLNVLKRQFPNTPIIGLTATATTTVIEDVKTILRIPTAVLFKAGMVYQSRRSENANLLSGDGQVPSKAHLHIAEILKSLLKCSNLNIKVIQGIKICSTVFVL